MNAYTFTIRQSTVVFTFTIYTSTLRAAKRAAGKRIRANYPGFRVWRIAQSCY